MTLGLVGKKIGMTRVFGDDGRSQPVTVIEASPNRITQIKTVASDGYDAIQVTVGARRPSRVNKAMGGHFAKAGVAPGRGVWEFRLEQPVDLAALNVAPEPDPIPTDADATKDVDAEATPNTESVNATGDSGQQDKAETGQADSQPDAQTSEVAELTVRLFHQGQKVDVFGQTIGKGFAGVMKRHGYGGGRATHGNSKAHRSGGSIGNAQDPGRVWKGKKMAGHMGAVRRVQQGLEVVRVDSQRNLLLVRGSVPGARGGDVIIQPSVKARGEG